jgi:hypothetical protein
MLGMAVDLVSNLASWKVRVSKVIFIAFFRSDIRYRDIVSENEDSKLKLN